MTESSSQVNRVGTVTGPFASLGARLGAFVIDRMLLLAFVAPAAALYYVALEDGSPSGRQLFFAGIPTLLTVVLLVVQWVNLARRGRTIGGFALGVSVVRGDGGAPLGFGKALLRTVVLQLIAAVPFLVLVAMILSAKHPRRQAWHDSAVGAVVVKATPESLLEAADRRAREAPIPFGGPPVLLDSSAPPAVASQAPASPAPVVPAPPSAAPAAPSAPPAAPPTGPPAEVLPPLPLPPPPSAPETSASETSAPETAAPQTDTSDLPAPASPEPEVAPAPASQPAPAAPAASVAPTAPAAPVAPAAPSSPPSGAAGGRLITSVPGFEPEQEEPSGAAPVDSAPAEPAPVVGRRRATPVAEEQPLDAPSEGDDVDGATRVGQRRSTRPTWVLVGEDGRRIAVRSTVVVGRDPDTGDHTGALPAAVPDPERSVSKTHAVLTVADGALRVDDLHSTNGTHVLSHGVESAVQPGQPLEIQPGDTVWFGDRAFVAEHGG
ncbi:RDD family protein [Aeromicrobium sp.]|uniref:RDD family protein n=1 Tax=Aeromicrobium sp. TaxID=1871063 RepID=UPI0025BA4A3C|nr:RDD family protein [Aeromicrobium sp.]MCK5891290.1 RDD family protein [Aeromicrobium sp.]